MASSGLAEMAKIMDEIGRKYPDFAARMVREGGNAWLPWIGQQVDAGDKTALEIYEMIKARGLLD